jgi:hypothetical protein
LNVPAYTTTTIAGWGTVDDYGTLVYWPWASLFRFYSQGH